MGGGNKHQDVVAALQISIGIILLAIFVIGSFMYVIIMGPSRYHRDGFVGALHRKLVRLPEVVCGALCCCITCSSRTRGRQRWARFSSQTFRERNWLMVGFYVVLVWTVEFLYLFFVVPKLEASLPSKMVSVGLVLISEVLYLSAVFADPGVVSNATERFGQLHGHGHREVAEEGEEEAVAEAQGATDGHKSRGSGSSSNATAGKGGKKNKKRHQKSGTHGGGEAGEDGEDGGGGRRKAGRQPKPRRVTFSAQDEYALNRRYVVDGMLYALAGDDKAMEYGAEELEYTTQHPPGTARVQAKVGFGQTCSTCQVHKPARARHCRLCGRCVRRYDHHCPWINNDVAEGTQRFFLGFLFTHAIECTWGAWDLYTLIKQFLVRFRAWGWLLRMHDGRVFRLTVIDYVMIIVNYQMLNFCLLFFATCIGLVLYGFWGYQMSYAMANLTMNDMNKIDDVAGFVRHLPSLDLVYREAMRVRARLEEVAERKPRALYLLPEPPLPMTEKGYGEGERRNKAYRRMASKLITTDLKGIYDRGVLRNLMEIFFPYSPRMFERCRAATDVFMKRKAEAATAGGKKE